MRQKVWFTIMLLSMLGLVARAEIVLTTANGAGADTYVANDVDSLSPNGNFGTENRVRIRNNSLNRARVAILRFDLSSILNDPTGAYLAFETTFVKSGGKAVNVYGVTDESLDFWIESGTGGVTYNTAPGLLPTTAGFTLIDETNTILLGSFMTTTDAAPAMLYTSPELLDLAGFLATDTNGLVTLLLVGADDETEIATRENTTNMAPTLTLPDANDIVARASAPVPATYTTISPTGLEVLSWTNPEPNNPGESITCDVYFGTTEPNVLLPNYGLALLEAGVTGNSVAMPALSQFQTYYWVVNIHDSSFPDRTVPGFVWIFDTNNAAPVANAGPDQYVWLTRAVVDTGSDADTYMRDAVVRGGEAFMDIRGGGVDFAGYLRFDLSELTAMGPGTLSDATLTLYKVGASRNDAINNGRFSLHGLNNVAGNTPQSWSEATLSETGDNPAGAEWTGVVPMDLLSGRITDLDDNVEGISELIASDVVTITGAALEAFLKDRVDDNGLVTFIIACEDGSDRGYGIATKENANAALHPRLQLTYLPDSAENNGDAMVTLSGSVTDDGLPDPPAAVSVVWTLLSGPEGVTIVIDPNDVLETEVELSAVGFYTFQLKADDGQATDTDTVQIYVGFNACDAAHNTPGYTRLASDLNDDCFVTMADFAIMASQWLDCTSLECP